jgi:hypothetical protein
MSAGLPSLKIESLPDEFFIDLAVGVHSYLEVCDNYNIDATTATNIETDPVFLRRLRLATQVVEDDGSAFKARCKTAVTNSVGSVINLMNDPEVSASVQLDAFKTLVKFGGLEPAKAVDESSSGPSLVLNIVAPDGTSFNSQTINAAPVIQHDQESDDIEDATFEIIAPAGDYAAKVFGAE